MSAKCCICRTKSGIHLPAVQDPYKGRHIPGPAPQIPQPGSLLCKFFYGEKTAGRSYRIPNYRERLGSTYTIQPLNPKLFGSQILTLP